MTEPSSTPHLEPHDVTAFVERRLDPTRRARIQAHLADCEECTAELAEIVRLRRPTGAPVRWLGAAAAAAAVIAVAVLSRPAQHRVRATEPLVRGDTASTAVSTVAPADSASLASTPAFVWRSVPGAAAYRISVSRANGDSVWAASVRDTSARPPEAALAPDTYYWYVDVLLSDGRSLAGSAHEFRLAR